ncbi:MAG TPA: hypothetical protein VLA61_06560 [Ideonella sp.]|uniref:hypothetical protein n=1 Tax=Ideonella sp. TaxID=1929293 RepID=UPI002B6E2764|nr:hypothetical protein [Ideonella sp.]HSI47911.1 hypothetical protein [Ideonella sp.]
MKHGCAAVALVLLSTDLLAGSVQVFPSGASVPENLLRIELRLPRPLPQVLDMRHVKLLDAAGQVLPGALLDLPLPSADGRQLTLLLHPGRVKSGLVAHERLGLALKAGDSVTLQIDDPALGPALRKTWQVTAADRTAPEPTRWRIAPPVAGSSAALLVALDAPVSASGGRLIAVRGPDGQRLPGRPQLMHAETGWRFVPAQPWVAGRYTLMVHPDLEDAAGNRACALFEMRDNSRQACDQGQALPFEVKP